MIDSPKVATSCGSKHSPLNSLRLSLKKQSKIFTPSLIALSFLNDLGAYYNDLLFPVDSIRNLANTTEQSKYFFVNIAKNHL